MGGFGAHYKGDVSEVTMGHETGLYIESGEPLSWTATDAADYTEIVFATAAGATGSIASNSAAGQLSVPVGMLIGTKMSFHGSVGNFSSYYYQSVDGKMYSIVDHTFASSVTKIKIVPKMNLAAATTSSATDVICIHSLGMPTIGVTTSINASAAASSEVSLIDQFIGLASFMTLPDTTVDIHKYHVIGLGRQAAVQQTGKVHHMGGALEMPLHSPRWLYYSLGREVVDAYNCGAAPASSAAKGSLTYTVAPGQTFIDLDSLAFGSATTAVGDYILIHDTTRTPTVTYKTPDLATTDYWPPASSSSLSSDAHHFEWTETSECRRIAAIEPLASGHRVFVDDPWQFEHNGDGTSGADDVLLRKYDTTGPSIASTNDITNPVRRLLFSSDSIPSFCIEHSVRNRDVGSYSSEQSSSAPGGATDSKQLTRIFRGCKVVEWELSSSVDAELKYRCIFDALSCYTDTGRLESANQGDRYIAHRMFQNTATDDASRKASGIANGSEKPFMFYNGSVEAFGSSLGFVSAFELRGKTGVELFHTIQSNPVAETLDSNNLSIKQVPYGGTRNASIIREGREEFEMEIDVVLTDATLFHRLRSHIETSGSAGESGNLIHLHFTKPIFSGGGSNAQSIRILIDDYVITEAPIPVPDDKGLLHSKIRLEPRNVKIISQDTLYHC
jgi:hypothetical protein